MTPEARVEAIESLLQQQFTPSYLEIEDNSAEHAGHQSAGGAGHFTIHISAAALNGIPLIQQHRKIYQALDSLMNSEIHALSIQVRPEPP